MIEKKFVQIGGSWGLIFPKTLLAALGVNPILDKAAITIQNDTIIIKKVRSED